MINVPYGALSRQRELGYSLSELIVVISIIGILAVVAIAGYIGTIDNYRINSATSKILSDIRYAQQQARVRSGWFGIQFQIAPTNQYHVYETDGVSDVDVVNPQNLSENLIIDVMADYRTTISAVDIEGGDKVEFSPTGTPYLDKNGSALSVTGTITLTCGSRTEVIQIVKNTGRAELQ